MVLWNRQKENSKEFFEAHACGFYHLQMPSEFASDPTIIATKSVKKK